MKQSISLRGRLLFGTVLWTIGLVIVASAALIFAIESHHREPSFAFAVHDVFTRPLVILFAVFAMVAGFLQVRQPLVNDLNALLESREHAVRRAIAKAGDLAHGLKTPLAILTHEAERAKAAGQLEVAAAVQQQVDRMRRQIDYHLAHARAAAAGTTAAAPCSIKESADGLARALLRLHAERGMAVEVLVPAGLSVRVQREDLDEMLGNLLDNACTWARTRVTIDASQIGGHIEILVDDDGCGLAEEMREAVLVRGVRADQAAPGSGLGLAIVRDLAEIYSGSISLEASPLGGLSARLRFPS